MISAGPASILDEEFSEEDRKTVESFVQARNEVCPSIIALHFEVGQRFHVPLFFADVRYFPSDDV
jgi:hypothetical protein